MSLQDSHQISDVKVMLVKGIDGNGIESIEKTSTQGLVDVYTITYTNGEKTTFTVTNGAGGGMPALIIISSEAGSDVSVTAPSGRALVVEQVSGSSTLWQCETTEYGTHLIDSVLGGDDAQVSLNIDACKIYTIDDNHFHADITVTYPSGATCSCGKSGETPAYATDNPFTFTVHSAGEYIITVEAYGQTFTETVTLTTSGQEESVSLPVGSTVTPTDDVQTLLACAMIGDSEITTLAELLADSTTLSAVIASQNAVDYLVRSTTFASSMSSDEGAMTLIGLNNYCSNTLLADNTWKPAICNSAYFEKVLNVKVPKMTGNTTPSGECFALNSYGGQDAFVAFDQSSSSVIVSSNYTSVVDWYVGYYFDEDVIIYKTHYYITQTEGRTENISITIQATKFKDNPVWEDLTDAISKTIGSLDEDILSTKNIDEYIGFRFDTYGRGVRVMDIQFYGRKDV